MSQTKAFPAAAVEAAYPVPEHWARLELQRAEARSAPPEETIDNRRLRSKLERTLDRIFAQMPSELGDGLPPAEAQERARSILERRWIDGARRTEVAIEFGVSEYRIQTIEQFAFKNLIREREQFVAYLDVVPDWLRLVRHPRVPALKPAPARARQVKQL